MNIIITFTDVEDARFPGRHILVGEVGAVRFYASYNSRRSVAEDAIRRKFVDEFVALGGVVTESIPMD